MSESISLNNMVRSLVRFDTARGLNSFEDTTTATIEIRVVARYQSPAMMKGMKAVDVQDYEERIKRTLCAALVNKIKEAGR